MVDTVLKVVFLVGLLAAEAVRAPHRSRNRRDRRQAHITDSRVAGAEAVLMTLSFVAMYVLPGLYIFSPWLSFADYRVQLALGVCMGILGGLAFAVGIWVLVRAHADLGRNWSPSLEVSRDQHLVTGGIYRYVRHPLYAAMWLFMGGQALLLHNWLAGLAGLVVYAMIYLERVPREEQMMGEHFGAAYRTYAARTSRVIPRLRRTAV